MSSEVTGVPVAAEARRASRVVRWVAIICIGLCVLLSIGICGVIAYAASTEEDY